MAIFNWNKNSQGRFISSFLEWDNLDIYAQTDLLETYYSNNMLYNKDAVSAYWFNAWLEPIKPYRNPTNRSVEFYASKLCQGTPKITVVNGNREVEQSIRKFLKWSNFDGTKRTMLRKDALHGNLFVKVSSNGEEVTQEYIDMKHVTMFCQESDGEITEIRIDVPQEKNKTYTEYWTLDGAYMATWLHGGDKGTSLAGLGTPDVQHSLSEFGIDFLPFVLTKFKDTGKKYGKSCIDHAIVKIDEVNRKHTRMSELLFQYNKPVFGVVNQSRDNSGRPLPIKKITSSNVNQNKSDDNLFLYVEGADIKSLIPDLKWMEVLAILQSDEEELERDLPELRYYSIKDSVRSGVALQTLLAGALDRAKEAQENFNTNQERLNEMALTIGKFYNIFPSSIGSYENGDFEHNISFDEIIPIATQQDKATTLSLLAGVVLPVPVKMKMAGYSQDEIDAVNASMAMSVPIMPETSQDMQDMMEGQDMSMNNGGNLMDKVGEMANTPYQK
jgi:hypothetical protein